MQSTTASESLFKSRIAPWLVFPVVMGAGLTSVYVLMQRGVPDTLAPIIVALVAMIVIALLERYLPYRDEWNANHGDVGTDVWHLLIAQLAIPNILKPLWVGLFVGTTAWLAQRYGSDVWPHHWPLLAQLFLMLLIAEFGRYWVHRAAHRVPALWRLHAVHHSPHRLYWLNAARFHPIEKVIFLIPEAVPFIILGTNIETLAMYAVFNSIHGLLQHSNIRLKAGWLNWVFSLTELHRWHHSEVVSESDNNFGNNLIVWDIVFGTYLNPSNRDIGNIGLLNKSYPQSYMQQLAAPFHSSDISKPPGYAEAMKG